MVLKAHARVSRCVKLSSKVVNAVWCQDPKEKALHSVAAVFKIFGVNTGYRCCGKMHTRQ